MRGYKFGTYATWWIRQAITRAIADQARTIRLPVHMIEIINKLNRTSRTLVQENGREPTLDEIAEKMRMSLDKVVIEGDRVTEVEAVIDPVFLQSINRIAGKRLTNDTEEKAREVPWSKT